MTFQEPYGENVENGRNPFGPKSNGSRRFVSTAIGPQNSDGLRESSVVAVQGLPVSLRQMYQHPDVEHLLGHQYLEPLVFFLQLLQPIGSSAFMPPY